jgi:hypothetical protein
MPLDVCPAMGIAPGGQPGTDDHRLSDPNHAEFVSVHMAGRATSRETAIVSSAPISNLPELTSRRMRSGPVSLTKAGPHRRRNNGRGPDTLSRLWASETCG